MAANTISMYFKVDPSALQSSAELLKKLKDIGTLCLGSIKGSPVVTEIGDNEWLLVFVGEDGSHAVIRVYKNCLITLDVQHFLKDWKSHPINQEVLGVADTFALGNRKLQLSEEYIRCLEDKVKTTLGNICVESNTLYCPIRRGQTHWPYMVLADDRLVETDFDEMVCEVNSPYQNVRIFHSKEKGNVLLLDGDIMLGESDLIYTQTLCRIGADDYTGKEVLILGGGDGGILHELLKENPAYITMAEIDEEVIKACRTHMRSVCGDSMDKFEGPNYKIMIEDCIKVLHERISNGHLHDYVINDLTEFPVEKAVRGYGYDFDTTSKITELSVKALKPGGKLLARGNCLSAIDYRNKFEKDLTLMGCDFKRRDVYVPSFCETYCLFEIWKVAS